MTTDVNARRRRLTILIIGDYRRLQETTTRVGCSHQPFPWKTIVGADKIEVSLLVKESSAPIKNGRLYGSRLMESAIGVDGSRRQDVSMVGDNRRLFLWKGSRRLWKVL